MEPRLTGSPKRLQPPRFSVPPPLCSQVAFGALLSLATISLNVVYQLPFLARISWGRK